MVANETSVDDDESSSNSCNGDDIDSEWSSEKHEDNDGVESCMYSATSFEETEHSFNQVCFLEEKAPALESVGAGPVKNEMVFTSNIKTRVNENYTLLDT